MTEWWSAGDHSESRPHSGTQKIEASYVFCRKSFLLQGYRRNTRILKEGGLRIRRGKFASHIRHQRQITTRRCFVEPSQQEAGFCWFRHYDPWRGWLICLAYGYSPSTLYTSSVKLGLRIRRVFLTCSYTAYNTESLLLLCFAIPHLFRTVQCQTCVAWCNGFVGHRARISLC